MTSSDENAGRDAAAIEAEAMAWLVERDEGFAPGRAAAFEAWRRRDVRHVASVVELEQVLAQLQGLAERRDEVNARFGRVSSPLPATVRWWRPVAWGGVALAVGGFLAFRAVPPADRPETRYATNGAGYERARLDDGSTLELNTASSARVRFTAAERRVELESGEAHFEVAHDPARPFVVSAGGVTVRAVGTAFNVRFASGAVEVTVTEGWVAVAPVSSSRRGEDQLVAARGADREGGHREAPTTSRGPTLLSAYERLALPLVVVAGEGSAPAIQQLAPAEVRAALAWQRRITDFSDTPLAEVAARFNRHNALQLIVADPALGARRIGGMFALDDVEAFLRLLERDGIIRVEREGDIVRLWVP